MQHCILVLWFILQLLKKIRHLLNVYNIQGFKDQPLEPMPWLSSQFQRRKYKLRDCSTSGSCHRREAVRTLRKYTEKEGAGDVTLTWDLKWAYKVEFFKYALFFLQWIFLCTRGLPSVLLSKGKPLFSKGIAAMKRDFLEL